MGKIKNLRPRDHEVTKENCDQVRAWGQAGMPFYAVAARLDIDEQTCRSHYHKIWLMGKHDVIAEVGSLALNTIRDMNKTIKEASDLSGIDKMGLQEKLYKSCDSFLGKRGDELWSTKQTIEQTNLNIEAPRVDISKLSEDEKDKLKELILKTKG